MKVPVPALLLVLALAVGAGANAQSPAAGSDVGLSGTKAAADDGSGLSEGLVRKVDLEARKLTLRHGPIRNLDMPEMSMVFRVSDPKMLEGLKPDAKVRFKAERLEGQITVTHLEPAS